QGKYPVRGGPEGSTYFGGRGPRIRLTGKAWGRHRGFAGARGTARAAGGRAGAGQGRSGPQRVHWRRGRDRQDLGRRVVRALAGAGRAGAVGRVRGAVDTPAAGATL